MKVIKLIDILFEDEEKILIPRRSPEERRKNWNIALQKQIQKYMKDGGEGDLDLSETPITTLPQGLKVGGHLYLSNTPITTLPQGLKVGGSLNLRNTPITTLPQGLKVGGYLDLSDTSLEELPQGLEVGGDLDLDNTPLSKKYTKKEIRRMVPGVKGKIYL